MERVFALSSYPEGSPIMAKAKTVTNNAVPTDDTASTNVTPLKPASILWGDKEIPLADLPDHAVLYLIQYGAKQSFADATAGLKKELSEKAAKTWDGAKASYAEDELPEAFKAHNEATNIAISEALAKAQDERLSRILAGTISVRQGPGTRVSSDDKIRQDIAKGMILDSVKAKGKKAPSADNLAEMVKVVLVKYAEKIEAEFLRRKAATQAELDLDF